VAELEGGLLASSGDSSGGCSGCLFWTLGLVAVVGVSQQIGGEKMAIKIGRSLLLILTSTYAVRCI
jgi:hypothetical protein